MHEKWKNKKFSYIYLLPFLAGVIFRFNEINKFIYNKRSYLCDFQSYKLLHLSLGAMLSYYYLINN